MAPIVLVKTGIEIISSVGIDTMITAVANKVLPTSYGLFGAAQKICVKVGSVGLSLVAGRAITKTIDEYLEELKTVTKELEDEE